jgi:hypothetical protein
MLDYFFGIEMAMVIVDSLINHLLNVTSIFIRIYWA